MSDEVRCTYHADSEWEPDQLNVYRHHYCKEHDTKWFARHCECFICYDDVTVMYFGQGDSG